LFRASEKSVILRTEACVSMAVNSRTFEPGDELNKQM
jgi:hypothetical protein